MPEVWFPYGEVETLVTIQAENLGTLVEQPQVQPAGVDSVAEQIGPQASVFLCDSIPATLSLLKEALGRMPSSEGIRVFSAEPKKVEGALSELKGRVFPALKSPPVMDGELETSPLLKEEGRKVFVATARPDPLFGIVDARVSAALSWVSGAMGRGASARRDYEPTPFEKTASFDAASALADGIQGASFITAVPRGGRLWTVMQDAPFDAIKGAFMEAPLPPARGLIVGPGGKGYDDTFSAALRSVWGALGGARKGGEVLMVAECGQGLGSAALEMLASGRLTSEGRRGQRYVAGLEEIYYLSKLKEEYGVLLLSGLPEVFVKGKLGLTSAKGSGEAVGRLLNKLGRTARVNLVTRASELRATSG